MGYHTGAPHLCWKFWLLGFTILLCICSSSVESSRKHGTAVIGPGVHVSAKGIQGGSVLFHVRSDSRVTPGAELKEITWSFGPESDFRVMLRVFPTEHNVIWLGLKDKYQQRVHVLNSTTLRIENLTSEDTGHYKAVAVFTKESQFKQVFHLTVYEPVPLPEILVQSESISRNWCNITLECTARGATEDLNVTWKSKDLPMEQEQSVTPGPAPNTWNLTMSLPLSQPHLSLTCVVSNQVDQKTATKNVAEVCLRKRAITDFLIRIPALTLVTVMLFACVLLLCRLCRKSRTHRRRYY